MFKLSNRSAGRAFPRLAWHLEPAQRCEYLFDRSNRSETYTLVQRFHLIPARVVLVAREHANTMCRRIQTTSRLAPSTSIRHTQNVHERHFTSKSNGPASSDPVQ